MANMLNVISAQVTVRPSGRQFLLEGNDSILQAGLKAGLRFGYGCGSGTCGLCKARVVAGEVRQIQHADYAHSFKFAASLQAAHAGAAPVLIRIETRAGHGAGKPVSKIIDETTDRWAFLVRELQIQLPNPYPPTPAPTPVQL